MSEIDTATPYNIPFWGEGYFDVAANGHVTAKPQRNGHAIDLEELTQRIASMELSLPVLVRFNDILQDRVHTLQNAFADAIKHSGFHSKYTAVYPIKVNQQRCVVEQLLAAGGNGIGLEAGSKPELLAVLALANQPNSVIICNGYKDREYIRLALIARKMGHRVYLIIEKSSELDIVLTEAQALAVEPLLGIRVRLASIANGNWQNTGGEKSKFGLTSSQLLAVCKRLNAADKSHCLQLLHFHLGSQIPNIRDIQIGLKEAARNYAELWRLGMKIHCVDVGGGLGIDYEGTRSRQYCSINYSIEEYAKNVVQVFADSCAQTNYPMPHIISESGRALTAHHAVLITNTIDVEAIDQQVSISSLAENQPRALQELATAANSINKLNALESYHDIVYRLSEIRGMYLHGLLNLAEHAQAEQLYQQACLKIRTLLNPSSKHHRRLLDELNECLADKLFVNFSVFQSLPDIWAIDQIFPILPLTGLDQPTSRRAVIQDLTCDSDGRVDAYVDGEGIESTLPINDHEHNGLIAFFLVGAYQEILGDIHNLFGDTHSVHVSLMADGSYKLSNPKRGDTVSDVLKMVGFDADDLLASYQEQLACSTLSAEQQAILLEELGAGLTGYTYLEE